ncbi:MAG: hypothetical protein ACKPJD_35845, partial [Planctomycetaceae bacterium]
MSSEGEDELRTEDGRFSAAVGGVDGGDGVDDATQVVRLSESRVTDSADQLKTILQSAGDSAVAGDLRDATVGGRYRLDRVLGEGAFGRVYLGFDTELRRAVAVKVPS